MDECFINNCNKGFPCREHDGCRIENKADEQIAYIIHNINANSFLKACPGSGKTEVFGLMAAYHIARWQPIQASAGHAVLTFTRNAADIISNCGAKYIKISNIQHSYFVGTIESWFNQYFAQPFGWMITGYTGDEDDHSIKLIDSDYRSGFLHAFETQ